MSAELCYYVFSVNWDNLVISQGIYSRTMEWNILLVKHSLNCWHQRDLFKLKVPLQSSYPPKVLTILTLTLLEKDSQYSHLQPPLLGRPDEYICKQANWANWFWQSGKHPNPAGRVFCCSLHSQLGDFEKMLINSHVCKFWLRSRQRKSLCVG